MEKLVINRSRWLRGEGYLKSRLYRESDGKMCCVGFYCEHVTGQPPPMESRVVDGVMAVPAWMRPKIGLRKYSSWGPPHLNSEENVEYALYTINDAENIDDETREAWLIEGFKLGGIEVTFVDKIGEE